MHYKAFLITKEFPTDDRIEEIMRPFDGEDYFNRKDEDTDEPYPVFTWDWYCVGGRYNSFFELDMDKTMDKYEWNYIKGCNSHDCLERAIIHRQLAELLEELRELRCKVFTDDPLIETTIEMLDTELREAKRLLKLAVEDIARTESCFLCKYYDQPAESCQTTDDCFVWRYADEAEKLIGGSGNG